MNLQRGHDVCLRVSAMTTCKPKSLDVGCCRLDEKIRKLDEQLAQHRAQIKKCRPGPAQEAAKRRALQVPGDKPFTLLCLQRQDHNSLHST